MQTTSTAASAKHIADVLKHFTAWLEAYGETSWDHQSFFAGEFGRRAKALYYRNQFIGTPAVAPMIFCEAFLPAARRFFHRRIRLPIADAHYAMGFAFLHEATGNHFYFERAVHFLHVLMETRCPNFENIGWGYPFDWITQKGTIPAGTPLITTTPYCFEAFLQMQELQPREEWKNILESVIRHVCDDIKDFKFSETANTCSYTPFDNGGVVNASAYRAFTLTAAAHFLEKPELFAVAERNLNFVLETQKPDGSWPYAVDGTRDFVDHFHTCFVMKALAKIYALTENESCFHALARGIVYYRKNLFGDDGMPKPFAKAPRLTVYCCELYDCAECINLCLLLRKQFPQLETNLRMVVDEILERWVKRDGSFRSRKLMFGWDNVPMHRWGQSQMFRALAFYLREMIAENSAAEKSAMNGEFSSRHLSPVTRH
ncbi:MAG TPA: hypothetical protein VFV23_12415 [Verrucomicrobiae bacterium]|nr:hypothetical protein [Verrucomicrobiae bacterium]